MSQYLVFPYGKVITSSSYLDAQLQAVAQYGKITATTVVLVESEEPVKGKFLGENG